MKTYIIDGNNLLHKNPVWHSLHGRAPHDAAQALIFSLENFSKKFSSYRIEVFFDGNEGAPKTAQKNIFIHTASHADTAIKERIKKISSTVTFFVVSSDTEVHNFARIHGCTVQSSENFLSELKKISSEMSSPSGKNFSPEKGKRPDKPQGVSKEEIKRMKKLFGLDD